VSRDGYRESAGRTQRTIEAAGHEYAVVTQRLGHQEYQRTVVIPAQVALQYKRLVQLEEEEARRVAPPRRLRRLWLWLRRVAPARSQQEIGQEYGRVTQALGHWAYQLSHVIPGAVGTANDRLVELGKEGLRLQKAQAEKEAQIRAAAEKGAEPDVSDLSAFRGRVQVNGVERPKGTAWRG
jgi:hypothetical protein